MAIVLDELAKQHWEYTKKVCELMYLEAFKHGFKHGEDHATKSVDDGGDEDVKQNTVSGAARL